MKNTRFTLILLLLACTYLAIAQDSISNKVRFEVSKVLSPFVISKEKVKDAQSLFDLNRYVKASWIKEYVSVEVLISHNGVKKKVTCKNDTLNQELIDLMSTADLGSGISVNIQYIPENMLKHNDVKEINFTFSIAPESDAEYPGGKQQMNKYLEENAIDKIPDGSFVEYDLTAVKFTINEEGQIVDAHVFESLFQSYENKKVDELLLEAICNMPNWKPAEYASGIKAKQEFVLAVGNMNSCVMPLLNIRHYEVE